MGLNSDTAYLDIQKLKSIYRGISGKYLCGIGWWNAPMVEDADGLDVAGGIRLGFHMHEPLASGGGGGAAAADSGNCRDSPTE